MHHCLQIEVTGRQISLKFPHCNVLELRIRKLNTIGEVISAEKLYEGLSKIVVLKL